MGRGLVDRRIWRLIAPVGILTVALVCMALLSQRVGLPSESLVQGSDALFKFAAGNTAATDEEYGKLKNIVVSESLTHGHAWITETVRDAAFPSDAPWRRLIGRIQAPEQVIDEQHPALLARINGILGVIATGCGSYPTDFDVHITQGRGISAYSMADGAIYISYMLAASLDDDEIAFALAHEIRHLRACHYSIRSGLTWSLPEPHLDAFTYLASHGFPSLLESAPDFYGQESECDAYAAYITAFCGYDPNAGLRLIGRIAEGDGHLYPPRKERLELVASIIGLISADGFSQKHLPALYLASRLKTIISSGSPGNNIEDEYDFATSVLLREGAALDSLMIPKEGSLRTASSFSGLFELRLGTRVETFAKSALTIDIALFIASPGISGMMPAVICLKALMLRSEDGWRLAAVFDTPGRVSRWSAWAKAEDKLPYAKPDEDGEMRYAIDALSAWKASFTLDPMLHMLCYSQSGIQPYFESQDQSQAALDLLSLSELFSSLEVGSEMRIYDITSNKLGRGFVSISFGYTVLAGGIPILVGSCRLGMVPERGGWAVAGVSLY